MAHTRHPLRTYHCCAQPLPPDRPSCSLPPICLAPWKAVLNAQCGGASLTSSSHLQGAAELGLEKIPEPIKEATALFYGEEGPRQ